MKFNITKILLLFIIVFGVSQTIKAQYAYGVSRIVQDQTTKKITTTSITALDYIAGLHYDPAVVGDVYQQGTRAGIGYDAGFSYIDDAVVKLRSVNPAPPNTRYDLYSDHYIIAYFYTTVVILDDDGYPLPLTRWYDPLGFSSLGGGHNPGWYEYEGSTLHESFYESQHFYLGTTGVAIITDPPPCDGASPLADGSCPEDLEIVLRNQFVDGDISSTTQNALLGARTIFSTQNTSSSPESITYKWKLNGQLQANQTSSYTAIFGEVGQSTVTVEAKQGNTTITKSVTINVAIPKLAPVDGASNGLFGVERTPLLTSPSMPCTHFKHPWVSLGCIKSFPKDRPSQQTAGFYFKNAVTYPDNIISNGNDSWIEFKQIIKSDVRRSGVKPNGQSITQCLTPPTPNSIDDWLIDKTGGNVAGGKEGVYRVNSNFPNRKSGNDSRIELEGIDSPAVFLESEVTNVGNFKNYYLNQYFKTYIAYFSSSMAVGGNTPVPFGTEKRHALAVLDWDWKARVTKINTDWLFDRIRFPTEERTLTSRVLPYDANSTGEISYSGYFDESSFMNCNKSLPVSMTTKRDVAVWRKNNGVWYVMNADGTMQTASQWGVDYDIPVPGDYDGDGRADFAVFRPDDPATPQDECQSGCGWYILKSSDGNLLAQQFGSKEDKPVPADYDGDGRMDIAVFRPSTNSWYYLRSSDNVFYAVQFGQNGDVPIPSDFDGDGFDDVAVWSPTNATWSILNSSNQSVTTQAWGFADDKPVIGDYDGDGKTDIANWQASGNWHILYSNNLQTMDMNFGVPSTDTAVPGDYDGDGKTDIAVWRPNGNQAAMWIILNSSNGQLQYQYWGAEGDIPIPAAYSRQ